MTGVKLARADLRGANLTGADLSRADLSRTNFAGADLTAAVLSRAILFAVNFKDVTLRGAALNDVKSLRQNDLLKARPSAPPTALPDYLTWPFVEKDGKWVLQEAN